MYEVACGTVFLHFLRDIVDDVEDIGGASVFVEFTDGVPLEVEPVGRLGRAGIPPFVEFEPALTTFEQRVGFLDELLSLVSMDAIGKLLQVQSVWWQQVTVSVGHTITLDVVLHDDEVTHAEGLSHHIVEFSMGTGARNDVTACQPDEEPHDAHQYQDAEGGVKPV